MRTRRPNRGEGNKIRSSSERLATPLKKQNWATGKDAGVGRVPREALLRAEGPNSGPPAPTARAARRHSDRERRAGEEKRKKLTELREIPTLLPSEQDGPPIRSGDYCTRAEGGRKKASRDLPIDCALGGGGGGGACRRGRGKRPEPTKTAGRGKRERRNHA